MFGGKYKIYLNFKLNKLILYVLFKLILFVSLYYIRTKKFENMQKFEEFLLYFIFFYIFHYGTHEKAIFLSIFFPFPSIFQVPKRA